MLCVSVTLLRIVSIFPPSLPPSLPSSLDIIGTVPAGFNSFEYPALRNEFYGEVPPSLPPSLPSFLPLLLPLFHRSVTVSTHWDNL